MGDRSRPQGGKKFQRLVRTGRSGPFGGHRNLKKDDEKRGFTEREGGGRNSLVGHLVGGVEAKETKKRPIARTEVDQVRERNRPKT